MQAVLVAGLWPGLVDRRSGHCPERLSANRERWREDNQSWFHWVEPRKVRSDFVVDFLGLIAGLPAMQAMRSIRIVNLSVTIRHRG
ncbi:hypothetical protein D3C76_1630930 [compost metagenome]